MSTAPSAVSENLAGVTAAGTSIWLDQIHRKLIESGDLAAMIERDCLRGFTSNPSIFQKAILDGHDYDEEIATLAREGLGAAQIFDRVAIKDLQLGLDVMRPVAQSTRNSDGFGSMEVAPRHAHDGARTLEQARFYWREIDRPNLMVKIPGTPEGVGAIEEATFEGINVNVTLLFSVEAYATVAEAYIRGLERRHEAGLSLEVFSVASFFVSRVDTEVDRRLKELGREELSGQAGPANARAAYSRFEAIFRGERFAALATAGAPVQRPLWASTGVKNPAYADTMYVDELLAPDTVNTMPMATLEATRDHGHPRPGSAQDDPAPVLEELAAAGVDIDDVTDVLLREGIKTFEDAMNELLAGVETQAKAAVEAGAGG